MSEWVSEWNDESLSPDLAYSDLSLLILEGAFYTSVPNSRSFHPASHSALYFLPNLTICFLRNKNLELGLILWGLVLENELFFYKWVMTIWESLDVMTWIIYVLGLPEYKVMPRIFLERESCLKLPGWFVCLFSSSQDMLRGGKGGRPRGRETSMWERNSDQLPLVRATAENWTCDLLG